MSRAFLSLFIVSAVFAHVCVGQGSPRCDTNETPKPCGRLCEQTCEKPEKVFCHPKDGEKCPNECTCKDGWLRNERTGKCVRQRHCPPARCPRNETVSICGGICEPSCTNLRPRPDLCPDVVCIPEIPREKDCECKKRYVRDNAIGRCIRQRDCTKCGHTEEVGNCGRECEESCSNLKQKCDRNFKCQYWGCRCKPGFFRNEKTGYCGTAKQCPKKCAWGEVDALCGRTCEGTCGKPYTPEICSRIKCSESNCRCDLNKGFVRDEKTGRCVQKKWCSRMDDSDESSSSSGE